MGLNDKKLRGQAFRPSAADWNSVLDAAQAEQDKRRSGNVFDPGNYARRTSVIRVQNAAGVPLDRFAAVVLSSFMVHPADNLTEFQNQTLMRVQIWSAGLSPDALGILLEPLAVDAVGECMVAGVCPVHCDMVASGDRFAGFVDGSTDLQSAAGGCAEILWAPSGTGLKWVLARIGKAGAITVRDQSGTPIYPGINTIQTDTSEGVYWGNPSSAVAALHLSPASATQIGVVNLVDQELGRGSKKVWGLPGGSSSPPQLHVVGYDTSGLVPAEIRLDDLVDDSTETISGQTKMQLGHFSTTPLGVGVFSGLLFTTLLPNSAATVSFGFLDAYTGAYTAWFAISGGVGYACNGFRGQTGISGGGDTLTGGIITTIGPPGNSDWITDTDGATVTFDLSLSDKHRVTLGGNRTLALSNPGVGQRFVIALKQDGSGSRTVTWWSGIAWPGGSAPALSAAANKTDVFEFINTGIGTYYGFTKGLAL